MIENIKNDVNNIKERLNITFSDSIKLYKKYTSGTYNILYEIKEMPIGSYSLTIENLNIPENGFLTVSDKINGARYTQTITEDGIYDLNISQTPNYVGNVYFILQISLGIDSPAGEYGANIYISNKADSNQLFTDEQLGTDIIKSDIEILKTDIEEIKTNTNIPDGSITPNKTSFFDNYTYNRNNGLYENNKRVNANTGLLDIMDGYVTTNFIKCSEYNNQYVYMQHSENRIGASRYAFYNAEKQFLSSVNAGVALPILVPDGACFIRCSWGSNQPEPRFIGFDESGSKTCLEYQAFKEPVIPLKYIEKEQLENRIVRAYLPKNFYVASGRTIEIYNNQVCPTAEKYHFQWICTNGTKNIGSALKKKFSIIGTDNNIGDYSLDLKIYDDDLNIIRQFSSTVHIVDNKILNNYSICNIGDSLSYKHIWYPEISVLSGNKLSFVGTIPYVWTLNNNEYIEGDRTSNGGTLYTGGCEGRPGAGPATFLDYETSNAYNFDGLIGTPMINPLTKQFDWKYYKDTYDIDPNIVQIFLGANGADLIQTTNANGIKTMIDKIREIDNNVPIFIVNTPYRADQNGIGHQQNILGFSERSGMFKLYVDYGVLDLMERLDAIVSLYNNVYTIPLALCFDSEHGFGELEVPVNPRSAITEIIPADSIHPNPQTNYLQYSDVMFSVYCGILK